MSVLLHKFPRLRLLTSVLPIVAVDALAKQWAVSALEHQPGVSVLNDFLRFDVVRNSGAAFSLGDGRTTMLFTILASSVVVGAFIYAPKVRDKATATALGLLVAGTAGNLLDRLFRAPGFGRGHVVDFIHVTHFPIFNVSDIAITFSAVVFIVISWRRNSSSTE